MRQWPSATHPMYTVPKVSLSFFCLPARVTDGRLRREGALSPHGGITDVLFIVVTDGTALTKEK